MNTVKLAFLSGPLQGQKLMFRFTATLGREPTNTIVLADPSVSSRNSEIFSEGERIYVRDLHSTNGTLVNDLPVEQAELHSGDMLLIGESRN